MNKIILCASTAVLLSACQVEQSAQGSADITPVDNTKLNEINVAISAEIDLNNSNTAMLIIDSQQAYVPDSPDFWVTLYYPDLEVPVQNKDPDLHNKLDRIAQLAKKATEMGMATTITYEGFEDEHSPFIDAIDAELPSDTQRFFKAYFNSTKEQPIHDSLQAWKDQGITQIVVSGAETDVCVLQTISGLKKMGFDVVLASDASFSTEIHVKPALKRLQQMGVKLAKTEEILASLDGDQDLTLSPRYQFNNLDTIYQGDRHDMAVVDFNFDQQSLALAEHDQKEAVLARTHQWSSNNHYLHDPITGMPKFHVSSDNLVYSADLLTSPNQYQMTEVSYVIDEMQAQDKHQAIISGVFDEEELLTAVEAFVAADITPVLMEDNIMGRDVDLISVFDKAYNLGAVPTTYKLTSYEIVEAIYWIDLSEEEKAGATVMLDNTPANGTVPELLPAIR